MLRDMSDVLLMYAQSPIPEMAQFSAIMETTYHLDASNCDFPISIYAI